MPGSDLQCLAFVELISSARPLCFLSGRNDAFWLLSEMIWRQMEQSVQTEERERAVPLNPDGCSFSPFPHNAILPELAFSFLPP